VTRRFSSNHLLDMCNLQDLQHILPVLSGKQSVVVVRIHGHAALRTSPAAQLQPGLLPDEEWPLTFNRKTTRLLLLLRSAHSSLRESLLESVLLMSWHQACNRLLGEAKSVSVSHLQTAGSQPIPEIAATTQPPPQQRRRRLYQDIKS
jgi:hypothetical protein